MSRTVARAPRGLLPLLVLSVVVVLTTLGLAEGPWVRNLHNGLLAVAFAGVGAYLSHQRPGHLCAVLFLATGAVQAVMFLGRQAGHVGEEAWLGWWGVWPVAAALGLVTLSILVFPDGRLPSRRWRPVAAAVIVVTSACSLTSALWPVEYDAAGLSSPHPISSDTPAAVEAVWSALAHPVYVALQVLWLVVVVVRWRRGADPVRVQLLWLVASAAVSAAALLIGLIGWRTPVPGLLTAPLIPVAAGWALVHGQQRAAYTALTWMSRSRSQDLPRDLPRDLARAAAQALGAERAVLWLRQDDRLHPIGVWPETSEVIELEGVTRPIPGSGALSIVRDPRLSKSEERLLADLVGQAALVLEHQTLTAVLARHRRAGHLEGLSPREQEVLDLMSQGLSNQAICAELHLSIKTVEPLVSAIFTKLELHQDADSNRRVLAVLANLRTGSPRT